MDPVYHIADLISFADRFLKDYSSLKTRPLASNQSVENVMNWHETYPSAIAPDECRYITHIDDLLALAPTTKAPLSTFLANFGSFNWTKFFQRIPQDFKSEVPYFQYDPKITRYLFDERIERFVNIIVCLVGFFMLVTPLWILLFVSSHIYQLTVITCFIAFFLGMLQAVTVARPFECLAATAA